MTSISRSEDLQKQLAYVRWNRLQNQHQIDRAMEKTRDMKKRDTFHYIISNQDSELSKNLIWKQSVIEDEFSKPLVLNKAICNRIKDEDISRSKKWEETSYRKLKTLAKLKSQLYTLSKSSTTFSQPVDLQLQQIRNIEQTIKNRIQPTEDLPTYPSIITESGSGTFQIPDQTIDSFPSQYSSRNDQI